MAGKKKTGSPARPEIEWGGIERALKLMTRHGLEEFEYFDGTLHVRLKKAYAGPPDMPIQAAPIQATPNQSAPAAATGKTAATPAAPEAAEEKLHIVKSPIVGTFYASPKPDASAFVKVGDVVSQGQVLCIIEAMKLMNEIESDVAGEIVRVLAENGQPVEYGEPLFAIRPTGPVRTA